MFFSFNIQLLQEERELKDVKTAVNGLVEVFKVRIFVLIFSVILFLNLYCKPSLRLWRVHRFTYGLSRAWQKLFCYFTSLWVFVSSPRAATICFYEHWVWFWRLSLKVRGDLYNKHVSLRRLVTWNNLSWDVIVLWVHVYVEFKRHYFQSSQSYDFACRNLFTCEIFFPQHHYISISSVFFFISSPMSTIRLVFAGSVIW